MNPTRPKQTVEPCLPRAIVRVERDGESKQRGNSDGCAHEYNRGHAAELALRLLPFKLP